MPVAVGAHDQLSVVELRTLATRCRTLATMLSAGLSPAQATEAAQCDLEAWAQGRPLERTLGAVWSLSLRRGFAPAHTMATLASFIEALATARREAELHLVGPRMTTRLVVWLPVISVVLASASGFAVLPFLWGTLLGWMLVLAGSGLLALSWWWSRWLLRRSSIHAWARGLPPTVFALAVKAGLAPPPDTEIQQIIAREGYRDPSEAMRDLADARAELERAQRWGVPAVALLSAQAELAQRRELEAMREASEKLAVGILIPLGVCVLPAFVLVGVVPVIAVMLSSTTTAG